MYTQVTFAEFLDPLFDKARSERGIEFQASPNVPIHWQPGDWLYEINNEFSVGLSRWLDHDKEELIIPGPNWNNPGETHPQFEERFERDFWLALDSLK
jgi:hypothetical protein